MTQDVFWIREIEPMRLALMPRPRAGDWLEDEVDAWAAARIKLVVSLLEAHEIHDLSLHDEAALCARAGIEFFSFPIVDRGVPASFLETQNLVKDLAGRLRNGDAVAIHCRAGIGRSGLIAACVLASLGLPLPSIFPLLSLARGVSVPDTVEQVAWVEKFAQESVGHPQGGRP